MLAWSISSPEWLRHTQCREYTLVRRPGARVRKVQVAYLTRQGTLLSYLQRSNRPLDDLKEFSTTMVSDINDLPATSPHGSNFGQHVRILELAFDPNASHGAATTHRETRVATSQAPTGCEVR